MNTGTTEGAIVGTVAYMSPEQAEGKAIDARSDIFSFGSVLYEMLNGRRAFQGDSKISTLSAILNMEPKPLVDVPYNLERVITRCLRKDPERRFQNMSDLKVELAELREESESGSLTSGKAAVTRLRSGRWLFAGISILVLVAIAVGAWLALRPTPYQLPGSRLRQLTSDDAVSRWGRLSPDGKHMAFVSDRAGRGQMDLFIQQVSGGSPIRLTDGEQKVAGRVDALPTGLRTARSCWLMILTASRAGLVSSILAPARQRSCWSIPNASTIRFFLPMDAGWCLRFFPQAPGVLLSLPFGRIGPFPRANGSYCARETLQKDTSAGPRAVKCCSFCAMSRVVACNVPSGLFRSRRRPAKRRVGPSGFSRLKTFG